MVECVGAHGLHLAAEGFPAPAELIPASKAHLLSVGRAQPGPVPAGAATGTPRSAAPQSAFLRPARHLQQYLLLLCSWRRSALPAPQQRVSLQLQLKQAACWTRGCPGPGLARFEAGLTRFIQN